MKKICFIGDYATDTGPGVANRLLKSGFYRCENVYFSKETSHCLRVLEAIYFVIKGNYIFLTSPTRLNILIIKIGKLLNKNMSYIMHGCLEYESDINNQPELSPKNREYEKYIFDKCDKIFCVSKFFMNFMKEREPIYNHKFDYIFNCLDIDSIKSLAKEIEDSDKFTNTVLVVGGDMKRKNNDIVCEAISKLNEQNNNQIKCIVVGHNGTSVDFTKYSFVEYHEKLPRNELLMLMGKSNLNILNSSFDTFGLSIIEGLLMGSSILLSNNVGAKDLFSNLTEDDLIIDPHNKKELQIKIKKTLDRPNHHRLVENMLIDYIEPKIEAKILLERLGLNYEKYNK